MVRCLIPLLIPLTMAGMLAALRAEPDTAPSGIYRAEEIAASPKMSAAGMVWWKERLLIADRGAKRLVAFTPPDKFETFREVPVPVGLAVDPQGNLILTEKDPARVVRIAPDGTLKVVADSETGTPHFVTVHRSGRVFWSGFPDGGTRSAGSDGRVAVHTPRIGHTYGIGLSPGQDFLYVASKLPDAGRRAVWRFPLDGSGKAGEGEVFFRTQDLRPNLPGLPAAKDGSENLLGWVGRLQGLAVDRLGYIYICGAESHTSGEAVAVIDPAGKKVAAMILGVPRNVTGLAFGGKDGRTLYITGAGEYRLFQVRLPVTGAGG